jgi:uncharacterized protein
MTLAFNVRERTCRRGKALAAAEKAGGKILKLAHRVFWGGYIGYFTDPDGHVWEVAHNPQFPFDERGQIVLPE